MIRKFFAYYRPWMGLFWLDFGAAVLSGMLELAFPLAVTGFIDHLLPRGDIKPLKTLTPDADHRPIKTSTPRSYTTTN